MKKRSFSILFLVLYLISFSQLCAQVEVKSNKEEDDRIEEFKGTQFLQIDEIDVPRELKIIEEQIRQNSLDVIISSKTHTPVFAQKMPDGYTESYKNFHSLIVRIIPIDGASDYYSLVFSYRNWTTSKKDKMLRKKISKYNVLNEMRFGLYELLLGKPFVSQNKDKIERQNYERIQVIRHQEEQEKRQKRFEQKENKKKQARREEELLSQEKKAIALLKRDKKDKKVKDEDSENGENAGEEGAIVEAEKNELNKDDVEEPKIVFPLDEKSISKAKSSPVNSKKSPMKSEEKSREDESVSKIENSPPVESNAESVIPRLTNFYAMTNFFNSEIVADGLLHSTTTLNYLGFGARYSSEQQKEKPTGYQFSLKVAMPVKKDNYSFPVHRSIESEIYKKGIFGHFSIFGGIDFSPVYFVNLATPGEGIQVFENDLFWVKAGVSFYDQFFEKEFLLRFLILKSLMVKSNQNKSLTGNSFTGSLGYWHNKKNGAEISFTQNSLTGDLTATGKSLLISYIYKFEN